jgi:hypothetical protein
MTMRIKFIVKEDTIISYGPQRVSPGQVMDVPDDSVANAFIGQGLAVADAVDPVSAEPLIDGGTSINGDPGGELEQETITG